MLLIGRVSVVEVVIVVVMVMMVVVEDNTHLKGYHQASVHILKHDDYTAMQDISENKQTTRTCQK